MTIDLFYLQLCQKKSIAYDDLAWSLNHKYPSNMQEVKFGSFHDDWCHFGEHRSTDLVTLRLSRLSTVH